MIQANHCPLRDLACLLGVHHAHIMNYVNDFVQTVRCQNYHGKMRVPTHMLHILYELPINMHDSRITTTTCTSGFMREEEDTTDFSVPFQISWSMRNIRRKNHWRHWLLSPR